MIDSLSQWLKNRIALRPWWPAAVLGTVCAMAGWCLSCLPLMRTFDDWLFDGCVSLRGQRDSPAARQIVIVGLDEESFERLGVPVQYISPKLARVIEFLNSPDIQARAIGVDVLVPDYAAPFPGIAPQQPVNDAASNDGTAALPGDMQPMREAIRQGGNVVLIQRLDEQRVIRPLSGWWFSPDYGPEKLACVELTEDRDYVARRQRLVFDVSAPGDESSMLRCRHLSVALLEKIHDRTSELTDGPELRLAGEPVPLDKTGLLPINFLGPPGTIREIPFWKVLQQSEGGDVLQKQDLQTLRRAVVIIGVTTQVDGDRHLTPFANNFFGVRASSSPGLMSGAELHANILATLWDRAFLWTLHPLIILGIVWLTGALLGITFTRIGLRRGLVLAIAHHFGWKFVAFTVLDLWYLRLDLSGVLLTAFLAYVTVIYQRWRWTRKLLAAVKSRELAIALERDPGLFLLRGEERVVTVMFADIRNFSDYCRTHSPHSVVQLLNAYFTAIVPIIEEHHGAIDKYAGDGIMVLFNALEPVRDHPLQAVQAAVRMVQRVHELRDLWASHDIPDLRIGVGIFTGRAIVGAVGSPSRLDYTAIGDSVNAAARIESENKGLGTEILLGAPTFESLTTRERTDLGCRLTSQDVEVKGVGRLRVHAIDVPSTGQIVSGKTGANSNH